MKRLTHLLSGESLPSQTAENLLGECQRVALILQGGGALGAFQGGVYEALDAAGVKEGFLPVAAPSSVIPDRKNEYYRNDEDCLHAIAEAMQFADHSEVELERLQAERRLEEKRTAALVNEQDGGQTEPG